MAKGMKIFNLADSYAGGGTFFNDGTYRIEESRFVMYDFGGKGSGAPACCLMLKLQPVDDSGKASGDAVVQYWPVGDKTEPLNKGKAIGLTSDAEHSTLWKGSDYYKFMEYLQKAEYDMDTHEDEDDISVLEGLIAEFGKIAKPEFRGGNRQRDDADGAKDEKKYPKQIIIVTSIPKQTKGAGSKASAKASSKKGAAKEETNDSGSDADGLLEEFLVNDVLVEKNAGGTKKLAVRMSFTKFLAAKKVTAEETREAMGKFNDSKTLGSVLTAAGWTLDGDEIKQAEE